VPRLFELPTALLEYLDLLQGDRSPLPLRVTTPTYMFMIIKMIEIYNIAAQPYYCCILHQNNCTAHPHLRIYRLKRRRFVTSYVQPVIQQYESKTVQKELIVITVAITDDFWNKWKPSRAIDTFHAMLVGISIELRLL